MSLTVSSVLKYLVVTLLLLLGILWFVMEPVVKGQLEQHLGEANGAEVNINEADIDFFPMEITLTDIEVTDPANPRVNRLFIQRAKADVAFRPLLMKKILVEHLQIDDATFHQPRERAGKVYRPVDPNQPSIFDFDAIELPSVDEVLANNELKTAAAVKELQQAYTSHQDSLKSSYENLPDQQALEKYKAQIEALKNTDWKNPADLMQAKATLADLKSAIKQEKARIAEFRAALKQAKEDVKPALSNLRTAPEQDYDRLSGLVSGDANQFSHAISAVFGAQARQWSQQLFSTFQMLAPLLEESEDAPPADPWVSFDEFINSPDLWIKRADISLKYKDESVLANFSDITHQHDLLGRPTLFAIDAASGKYWRQLNLEGQLSMLAEGFRGQQSWEIIGASLSDLPLAKHKLVARLISGVLDASGNLALNGQTLSGLGTLEFADLNIDAQGTNRLTKALAGILTDLTDVTLKTRVSGNYREPSFGISSDLDQQFAPLLMAAVGGGAKDKLEELKAKLTGLAAPGLELGSNQLGQWDDWQNISANKLGFLEQLLGAELGGKDSIKDKLLNKLFNGNKG